MIVSAWYEADHKERDVTARLALELPARGGWYCVARSHAKVQALELVGYGPARWIVIESSANLRTCHNIEQFTVTNDRDLLVFHRTWMHAVEKETRRLRGQG